MSLPSTLIIGYGNPDRQDDGLAWHVLAQLAAYFQIEGMRPGTDDFFPVGHNPDLLFTLQLTPELAETVARYERICFIDAHTGEIAGEISVQDITPQFRASPLTHHMTPQTLLSLVKTLYQKKPESVLFSIHGFEFGFSRSLSGKASVLVQKAVENIIDWFQNPD